MAAHKVVHKVVHTARPRVTVAVVACWCVAVMAVAPAAGATVAGARRTRPGARVHGISRRNNAAAPAGSALIDGGGPVLSAVHPYAIWWGPKAGFPSDAMVAMRSFFGGLGGSGYLGLANQYLRGAHVSMAPLVELFDSSAPKASSQASIAAEVSKLTARHADPSGVYFVFTSTRSSGGTYCAWHASTRIGGHPTAFAYMPSVAGVADCDPGDRFGANRYSEGSRALVNVTAHELMEAVTDPQPAAGTSAWLDRSGEEIGDKCAWQFTAPVRLANGSTWQLQQEWSNAAGGCAQG